MLCVCVVQIRVKQRRKLRGVSREQSAVNVESGSGVAVTENRKGIDKKVVKTKRREDEQRKDSVRDDKEFKKTKHSDGEESKAGEKEFRIEWRSGVRKKTKNENSEDKEMLCRVRTGRRTRKRR